MRTHQFSSINEVGSLLVGVSFFFHSPILFEYSECVGIEKNIRSIAESYLHMRELVNTEYTWYYHIAKATIEFKLRIWNDVRVEEEKECLSRLKIITFKLFRIFRILQKKTYFIE